MRYTIYFGPEILHVSMEGCLTFTDACAFKKMLLTMADKRSRDEIRLNIEKLEHMDSTGLYLMMMAHDLAKKLHRMLIFVGPQGQVRDSLNRAAAHNALRMTGS